MSQLGCRGVDTAQCSAQPASVQRPRLALFLEGGDVRPQLVCPGEPLTALTDRGELAMSLLFDGATAALEGQELVVPDAGQPLSRTPARADLHATVESDVVHDVDTGEGEVGIGGVADAPSAGDAAPRALRAYSPCASAERAGAGEKLIRRHGGRLRGPSDTRLFCAARSASSVEPEAR